MICEWCVLFHFTVTIFDISCFQKFKIYGVYDSINNCGGSPSYGDHVQFCTG